MPTPEEIEAATTAIRAKLDRDVPGMFRSQITDAQVKEYATAGLEAAEAVRNDEWATVK